MAAKIRSKLSDKISSTNKITCRAGRMPVARRTERSVVLKCMLHNIGGKNLYSVVEDVAISNFAIQGFTIPAFQSSPLVKKYKITSTLCKKS